jgi:hypothetical protein
MFVILIVAVSTVNMTNVDDRSTSSTSRPLTPHYRPTHEHTPNCRLTCTTQHETPAHLVGTETCSLLAFILVLMFNICRRAYTRDVTWWQRWDRKL